MRSTARRPVDQSRGRKIEVSAFGCRPCRTAVGLGEVLRLPQMSHVLVVLDGLLLVTRSRRQERGATNPQHVEAPASITLPGTLLLRLLSPPPL